MAALIIWGALQIGKFIANIIPSWHIPFLGNLRDVAMAGINIALHAVQGWLSSAVAPLGKVFAYPVIALGNMINVIKSTFDSVWSNLYAVLHVHLPYVLQVAKNFAYREYVNSITYAHSLYVTAVHTAERWVHAAEATAYRNFVFSITYAHNLYVTAVQTAERWVHAAEATAYRNFVSSITYAHDLYTIAVHDAERWVNAARAEAIHGIARAEATAAAGITAARAYALTVAGIARRDAITAVNTTVAVTDAAVWPKLRDEVAALEGVIATDLPALGSLVKAIPRAVPRDLAESIAASAAVDIAITRFLRDCGVPNCKGIGGLARELPKLLEVVEGAAFLGFIAAMIEAPEATARETTDILDPVMRTVGNTLVSAAGGL
jgi:hypothetical protein